MLKKKHFKVIESNNESILDNNIQIPIVENSQQLPTSTAESNINSNNNLNETLKSKNSDQLLYIPDIGFRNDHPKSQKSQKTAFTTKNISNLSSNKEYLDELAKLPAFEGHISMLFTPIDYFVWGYLSAINETTNKPLEVLYHILPIIEAYDSHRIDEKTKFLNYNELAGNLKTNIKNQILPNNKVQNNFLNSAQSPEFKQEIDPKQAPNLKDLNQILDQSASNIADKSKSIDNNKIQYLMPNQLRNSNNIKKDLITQEKPFNIIDAKIRSNKLFNLSPESNITNNSRANMIEEQKKIETSIKQNIKAKKPGRKNCTICIEDFTDDEFDFILSNCQCKFHHQCLKSYAEIAMNDGKIPIRCPDSECKDVDILMQDLKLLFDQKRYSKYEELLLSNVIDSNAEEYSWCPTPNCSYAFVRDNLSNDFHCSKCNKRYCLRCRVEYHKNQTCKEWQISNNTTEDDHKFEKLVNGMKFKQCSKCKFWVEKDYGCDYMRCRCKNEFCYRCGLGRGVCNCGGFLLHPQGRNMF